MKSKKEQVLHKILSIAEISKQINVWKLKNQKIVFTNGCFDILHRGHVETLLAAAALGNKLVIGLNSDLSVKRLKGNSRPVFDENNRAFLLAAQLFVDAVIIFEEDTPLSLIELIEPDILVKGGDYEIKNIVGAEFVLKNGGEVLTIPFIKDFSTTLTIEKIKK